MKKKQHTVGTVPTFNGTVVESSEIVAPNIYKYMTIQFPDLVQTLQ